MIDYITFLVTNIVSKPENVSIKELVEDDSSYTYIITVDKDDMGMLIGREGRTIKSCFTYCK